MKKTLPLTLAVLFLAVSAAAAQKSGLTTVELKQTVVGSEFTTVELKQTRLGFELGAKGLAQLYRKRGVEGFAVKVTARTDDGTLLIVSCAARGGEPVDVGMIEMRFGSGSLELSSHSNPFSPAFPISQMESVFVRLGHEILLEGKVPKLTIAPR